ncbi:MAG: hypothetical protein V4649_06060 [Bacteroidota bacterium]
MQKIDKSVAKIVSTKYKAWVGKLDKEGKQHEGSYRYYYDDVAMNLYKCQSGVCAYTEMYICPAEMYGNANWVNGRYKIPNDAEYKRIDHLGEMDHFDPENKKTHYWNWDNLFMIEAKINSIKSNNKTAAFLKPDLADYSPEKYFDYDDETNRYVANTDIKDEAERKEIQTMIDEVLLLNHGVVRNERRDYIKGIKFKIDKGEPYTIDRFFTAVQWTIDGKP